MPLTAFTGTLGHTRAAHLLRRASFGPSKADIDFFANLTPQEAMLELFPDVLPEPELPVNPETGVDWLLTGTTGPEIGIDGLTEYFLNWLIGETINQSQGIGYNVREKLVFFLHTHFTTQAEKVRNSRSLYYQNQLFRIFANDKNLDPEFNFKSLVKKICVDNAMLMFLDGRQNVKGSPNENYARELLELYTIGRGLEGTLPTDLPPGDYVNYTEQDVQAAARVLSGYKLDLDFTRIDEETNLPRGYVAPGAHDNDPKEFSTRFDNAVIQGNPALMIGGQPTEESSLDEMDQLIELIYTKEESSRYLARRIYRFYVYHEITAEIESTIISEMAATFIAGGYKLQPMVEELLQSTHFYDAAAGVEDDKFGGIIKSPLDLVAGTLRFFGYELPDRTLNTDEYYQKTGMLRNALGDMGMPFYNPFEVAGYGAYHQFPVFNRNWISSNYLTNRYNAIRSVVDHMNLMEPDRIAIDTLEFIRTSFNGPAANAETLCMTLVEYLFPVHQNLTFDLASDDTSGLTAERMRYFMQAFLYEPQIDEDPEGSWAFRWSNSVDSDVLSNQLDNLFNALMQSPEYQLK